MSVSDPEEEAVVAKWDGQGWEGPRSESEANKASPEHQSR